MNVKETRALAARIRAALRADRRGQTQKVLTDEPIGVGISWLWMLPPDHAWNKRLAPAHDRMFDELDKYSTCELNRWWIVEAWRESPTANLKLLYFLTLPAVLSWTAFRKSNRKRAPAP